MQSYSDKFLKSLVLLPILGFFFIIYIFLKDPSADFSAIIGLMINFLAFYIAIFGLPVGVYYLYLRLSKYFLSPDSPHWPPKIRLTKQMKVIAVIWTITTILVVILILAEIYASRPI